MDLRASIANQTDVGLGITKQLLQTEGKDKNVVYSPLSIHVVLSLIAAGSKGPTQEQLLSFLKSKFAGDLNSFASELVAVIFSDGSPSGGPRLSFANGIWVDKPLPLKPSFKQVVETAYKAALNQVDFQTKVSAFYPHVILITSNGKLVKIFSTYLQQSVLGFFFSTCFNLSLYIT